MFYFWARLLSAFYERWVGRKMYGQISLEPWQFLVIGAALALSGVIKGATGAGAPIFAIPTMAAIVDVRFAILTMLMPNLLSNIWQAVHFRSYQPDRRFLWPYVGFGGVGVALGSALLVTLSADVLAILVSVGAGAYVVFRLAKPGWRLSMATGRRFAAPAGFGAGLFQGATGLAAPVLLTFLNALRLERLTFVATVSLVFLVFAAVQITSLTVGGLVTLETLAISLIALAPMALGMVIGHRLLAIVSAAVFDKMVLALLSVIVTLNVIGIIWS